MIIPLDELQALLAQFPQRRIGLVGDLFLDRYLEIDAARDEISIETGLVAYQVTAVRNSPGALGTVMNNLAALGVGQLVPIAVLGDDGHGDDLLRSMQELPVDGQYLVRSAERLTPTYTKPMRHAAGDTAVVVNRLDVRSREPLTPAIQRQVETHLRRAFLECDGWIVLDQIPETECGVVNRATRAVLQELAATHPEKLVVIDSRRHLGVFEFGCAKGNRAEFLGAVGEPEDASDERAMEAARQLAEQIGRAHVWT